MESEEEVILKVSSSKDKGYSKKVAAAMGWRLREVGYCQARAIQAMAVNSTIKAVAITNERVRQAGIKFGIAPTFDKATAADDPSAVAISVMIEAVTEYSPGTLIGCKVSGKEDLGDHASAVRLSGAITGITSGGKGVSLKCVGPKAVYRAVMASVMARSQAYGNGMDSVIVPTWETVETSSGKLSLIRIDFWNVKKS